MIGHLFKIIKLIIILFIVDLIWLFSIKGKYGNMVNSIQKAKMQIKYKYIWIVYLFIGFGLYTLILSSSNYSTNKKIILAFIYGLTAYGIYDFTGYVLFDQWDYYLAIYDTLWGGVLCAVSTYLFYKIKVISFSQQSNPYISH